MLRKLILLVIILTGVLSIPVQAQDATFSLTIMHTNDTHSHHDPNNNGDGGAAREATVVKQIRSEVENSILLNAGDRFTGTLYHQQYRGQDDVQIMNAIGYDAMTLGNHEFDDGDKVLADFVDGVNFPVVTADVDFSKSTDLAGKINPYTILTVGDQKIGVIGLVTPDTPFESSPGKELIFSDDVVAVTQKNVDDLTAQGVNKIILLTHVGFGLDQIIAAATRGVDVIVGGHSHTLLGNGFTAAVAPYPTVAKNLDGDPVYVVQAGEYDQYLGRLNVTFDADGKVTQAAGDTILLSRYITPDPAIVDILTKLAAPIETLKQTPVGESSVFLVGDRAVCRVEECNLGDLIADAMRAETGAQIAIQNGGGVRSNVPVGADTPADITLAQPYNVTLGDVLTVLPFGNLTATLKLKGSDVVVALENGVSQVESGAGRFPQVSGLHVTWDGSKEPGSRIVSVDVEGADGTYAPIEPDTIYTVATNDFMRRGGDEYTVFSTDGIDAYDFGKPLDQVLAEYIKANGPVAPVVEGRITRIDVATPAA
ncbi:MAG: multifunctional 2',3'-cyclic-nucleotide 2'-phosphodiesterase/5'-nucleotidase/3'-nucleotidase [Chloroflexi bacterium]|nr:multifunctional 2',3'-cyclic-nucleotide 2'-phosphodiesterase/5'-nucleotidase/3'-nucleotidase [Chloroflexota bacterium]